MGRLKGSSNKSQVSTVASTENRELESELVTNQEQVPVEPAQPSVSVMPDSKVIKLNNLIKEAREIVEFLEKVEKFVTGKSDGAMWAQNCRRQAENLKASIEAK